MKIFLPIFFLLFFQKLNAQNPTNQELFQANITKSKSAIKIDGNLDEEGWSSAAVCKDFLEKYPRNESLAKTKTEVKITYDDQFIYFGATCYQNKPFIISTLKREINIIQNDGIAIALDPVNKKNNGFLFSVSAYGVQGDALISISDDEPNANWDGKWYAETKHFDDKYTLEIAIPFKTLRFEDNKLEWGINIIRSNLGIGEYSSWAKVPLQFDGYDLGYMGKMSFDQAPKRQKNIAFIPYISANYTKEENEQGTGFDVSRKPNAGFDAKIALNSSLNLDLTTNPDFSQVDADQLVTNLTRFSIFLPERRLFFLENNDIFSFGIPPLRPFFSRTIGLDAEGLPEPIIYGARLTGNIAPTTRIGILNTQTAANGANFGQNVSVATVQQNIKGRSFMKGFFLNRQSFDDGKVVKNDYGRNVGLENVFVSSNGKWQGWLSGHASFKPNVKNQNYYYELGGLHSGKNFFALVDYVKFEPNYYTDQGFVQRADNYDAERDTVIRLGFSQIYNESSYSFYPKKENAWYQQIEVGYETFAAFNPDNSLNERTFDLGVEVNLRNLSNFEIGVVNNEVNLPFATAFTDEKPLPVGNYKFSGIYTNYSTDRRKALSFKINLSGGGFYNGSIRSTTISSIYRARPWGNFELNYSFNDIKFPTPYGGDLLTLFGGKMEINFSRNLFWTTFVQFNSQNDKFNFNSRVQWRFKPLSDVFLVYTDNYNILDWQPKYRALVFKVNYWLNL